MVLFEKKNNKKLQLCLS